MSVTALTRKSIIHMIFPGLSIEPINPFKIFLLLHQSILYRHLLLFLRIGCSDVFICQQPEEGRQELSFTTLATDSAVPSCPAAINNSHVSYAIFNIFKILDQLILGSQQYFQLSL